MVGGDEEKEVGEETVEGQGDAKGSAWWHDEDDCYDDRLEGSMHCRVNACSNNHCSKPCAFILVVVRSGKN